MTFEERLKLFCENLRLYLKSVEWLRRSLQRVGEIGDLKTPTEEELERIETLFSRYARSMDILLNRVLRSLDLLELEEPMRKLDIVIRAEKRGLVANYETLIELKDLRNELAHEYIEEALLNRLGEVREASEKLLGITEKLLSYIVSKKTKNLKLCFY